MSSLRRESPWEPANPPNRSAEHKPTRASLQGVRAPGKTAPSRTARVPFSPDQTPFAGLSGASLPFAIWRSGELVAPQQSPAPALHRSSGPKTSSGAGGGSGGGEGSGAGGGSGEATGDSA